MLTHTMVLLGAVLVPTTATAAPIGLRAGLSVCVDSANDCPDGFNLDADDPTTVFSYSGTFSSAAVDVSYSGNSRAGYGVYGADVSASFTTAAAPRSNVLFGAVSLERLTISDPLRAGQDGLVSMSWQLDGTMNSSGLGFPQLRIQNCVASAGSLALHGPPNGDAPGCVVGLFDAPVDSHTAVLPFVFGTPFDWRTRFLVIANASPGTGVGTASVDYFHTMTLDGLRVFAQGGEEVVDPLFSGESGTRYSSQGVVPEPGSMLLLGTGLLGLVAKRGRRKER